MIDINLDNTVSVRSFLKNFSKVNKNKVTIVLNRNKINGAYIPYSIYKSKFLEKKVSIKDLKKYFFRGQKDLSSKIDSIYK